MRLIVLLLTGTAALGIGLASHAAPAGNPGRSAATGLCRRAPPLPPLAAEAERGQAQGGYGRPTPRYESATAADGIAPPPPPVPEAAPPAPPAIAAPPPIVAPAPAARTRDGIAVTGSLPRGPSAAPGSAFTPRRTDPARPPAGLLTAGEHDDLLNPELYASYVDAFVKGEPLAGVPRVDTARVLTVSVRDGAGRPLPFAPVTLTCADGNRLTLATLADGNVAFFPDLDRLGREVTIGVPGADGPRRATLAGGAGGVTERIVVARPPAPVRALDLALVVDCTGSMGDELSYLQSELRAILTELRARHPDLDLHVALIAYRDRGDDYVTRTFPLTGDVGAIQAGLGRQRADGGGDEPESMEVAMARAAGLAWRAGAVHSLFLVADAPPHADDVAATWAAAERLRASRVQIVPVAASGVARGAEYIMRAMAAATQSRYLFLTDDSGIGNPHAPPAIDCYQVTRLADAMRRVLDGQLSGRRVEPDRDEIIRTVGTYDAGRCVLPSGWDRWQ
ncbi:vWA domain-containing protein [Sphingomonas sp.]|uniref:vWA domain-containing protein n=1 Tax=Sphingomonas sp. TaxID=28214 RepID=UPI003CC5B2E2